MSSSRIKAKKQANNAAAQKAVVEEAFEGGMPKPISFKEFAHYAGLDLEEGEVMEETAEEETPEMVTESFFKLYDKMENLNG